MLLRPMQIVQLPFILTVSPLLLAPTSHAVEDSLDDAGFGGAETAHALEDDEDDLLRPEHFAELKDRLAALRSALDDRGAVDSEVQKRFRDVEQQVETWEAIPRGVRRRRTAPPQAPPPQSRRPLYMYFMLAAVPAMHLLRFLVRRYDTGAPPNGGGQRGGKKGAIGHEIDDDDLSPLEIKGLQNGARGDDGKKKKGDSSNNAPNKKRK